MRYNMKNLLRMAAGATVFTIALAGAASATSLTLLNGWTGGAFGAASPTVQILNGVVRFRGAISGGTTSVLFTLPSQYIPDSNVFAPIDLCNATNGRLVIYTNGNVSVDEESGTFSNAQCFTSLDGASFALSVTGYVPLKLRNGWSGGSFGTKVPAAKVIDGIVQFEGAMSTSRKNTHPFIMPARLRPATDVYVALDLCDATNGRLHITPSGSVDVEAEGNALSNAQCFTSLDGASYAMNETGATPLTLINGWVNAPFVTSNAAVRLVGNVVHLQGAIATSGTSAAPFVMPAQFRPSKTVWVQVDLCNATNGRLVIDRLGNVTVQPEGGTFSNAQCFTSLDGATYRLQ